MRGIGTGTMFVTASYTSAQVLSGGVDGEEVPIIDMAHMASANYREKIPGELKEPPQVTVEIIYDPSDPPPVGVVETGTLTWPDGATLTGTGFIVSQSSEAPLEDKMTGTFVFQYDGQTGPAYEPAST